MVEIAGVVSGRRAQLAKQIGDLEQAIVRTQDRIDRTRSSPQYKKLQKRLKNQRVELKALRTKFTAMPAED